MEWSTGKPALKLITGTETPKTGRLKDRSITLGSPKGYIFNIRGKSNSFVPQEKTARTRPDSSLPLRRGDKYLPKICNHKLAS